MSDLTRSLRWISRVQIVCILSLIGSGIVGLMSIMGNFGPVWSIVWGILSAVVFVASIVGLNDMNGRIFEIEESFHQRNYELRTTLLEGRPW